MTDSISDKFNLILSRRQLLTDQINDYQTKIEKEVAEEDRLLKSVARNTASIHAFGILFERLNAKGFKTLSSLLDKGISRVFINRNYSVEHDIRFLRQTNNLFFTLIEKKNGDVIKSDIGRGTGGSIRALCGLISCCFYLMKSGAKRVLIMDEALSQIADEHVETLFTLLKSLAVRGKFIFLFVTHDSRFKPYFDKRYEIKDGRAILRSQLYE